MAERVPQTLAAITAPRLVPPLLLLEPINDAGADGVGVMLVTGEVKDAFDGDVEIGFEVGVMLSCTVLCDKVIVVCCRVSLRMVFESKAFLQILRC